MDSDKNPEKIPLNPIKEQAQQTPYASMKNSGNANNSDDPEGSERFTGAASPQIQTATCNAGNCHRSRCFNCRGLVVL